MVPVAILYAMFLVEGRDELSQAEKEFQNQGKTVSLLLRLTSPIWGSSKVVVLDSGFCALQGIAKLWKKKVFGAALIKKCCYWPKYIQGNQIKKYVDDKAVGAQK